jgi:hypothetical protein
MDVRPNSDVHAAVETALPITNGRPVKAASETTWPGVPDHESKGRARARSRVAG